MKATANGVINLSILDGWWDEAYSPETGWAIGKGESYDDPELQNEVESNAIYDLLEKEIVPLFYERGRDGLPRGWIDKMKSSMTQLCPVFNTNRMVREYFENFYMPTAIRYKKLKEKEMEKVKELAHWKSFMKENWGSVKILNIKSEAPQEVSVGTSFEVHASVHLGNIKPGDVQVEIYFGAVNSKMQIVDAEPVPMTSNGNQNEGNHEFVGTVICKKSGKYGYSLRIRPNHEDMNNPFETGLIIWSN